MESCPVLALGIQFRLKSDFYSVASRGKGMDLFQKLVEKDLTHLARRSLGGSVSDKLTNIVKMALRSLSEDDSIVIRNVDKGGSVVVLDCKCIKLKLCAYCLIQKIHLKLRGDPTQSFKKDL